MSISKLKKTKQIYYKNVIEYNSVTSRSRKITQIENHKARLYLKLKPLDLD